MAYDREHGVLVWGGTLPGGEIWSNSVRMAETEEVGFANDAAGWDVQALLDHYTAKVKTHHANSGAQISPRCKLTYVKFNRVDINGHYIDPVTYEAEFAPIAGGGSTFECPNQICLVITLTTAVSRGPASKGRIFAPMPTALPDATTGVISTAAAGGIATAYKTFFEACCDVPGLDEADSPGLCVMSKVNAGATRRVNGIRVGVAYDTQRRRRNNLLENYQSVVVDQGVY